MSWDVVVNRTNSDGLLHRSPQPNAHPAGQSAKNQIGYFILDIVTLFRYKKER